MFRTSVIYLYGYINHNFVLKSNQNCDIWKQIR